MLYATLRRMALPLLFAGVIVGLTPNASVGQTMSTSETQAIEKIIREYILKKSGAGHRGDRVISGKSAGCGRAI